MLRQRDMTALCDQSSDYQETFVKFVNDKYADVTSKFCCRVIRSICFCCLFKQKAKKHLVQVNVAI